LIDIASLILSFIFSSIADLRYQKCQALLEKFGELETHLYQYFKSSSLSRTSLTNSRLLSPPSNRDSPPRARKASKASHRKTSEESLKKFSLNLSSPSMKSKTPKLSRDLTEENLERAAFRYELFE